MSTAHNKLDLDGLDLDEFLGPELFDEFLAHLKQTLQTIKEKTPAIKPLNYEMVIVGIKNQLLPFYIMKKHETAEQKVHDA